MYCSPKLAARNTKRAFGHGQTYGNNIKLKLK